VWALIAGAVLSAFIKLVASHLFCPGPRHSFCWDRSATHDLFHFGKWIFFSTLFGFLASKGDQVILGWYMTSKAEFGLYFMAASLSGAVVNGVHTISGRVLFPVYARLAIEAPDSLRRQTFRVRAILMVLTVPPVCVLAIWGQEIVQLLYKPDYHGAGWMLQILATGAVVSVIGSTVGPVLLAMGDSYRFMIIQIARTVIMCITMATCGYIGWQVNGETGAHVGVLIGVALPEVFLYPVLVWAVRRYGVWLPKLDITGFLIAGIVIALGLML
jgi:O-antigen/teichoic acid export membrane protein